VVRADVKNDFAWLRQISQSGHHVPLVEAVQQHMARQQVRESPRRPDEIEATRTLKFVVPRGRTTSCHERTQNPHLAPGDRKISYPRDEYAKGGISRGVISAHHEQICEIELEQARGLLRNSSCTMRRQFDGERADGQSWRMFSTR
jgi:hypothetical protein